MIPLHEILNQAMANKHMTQSDLIKATGLKQAIVSHYLTGKRLPPYETLYKIANILDLDMTWLFDCMFGGDD